MYREKLRKEIDLRFCNFGSKMVKNCLAESTGCPQKKSRPRETPTLSTDADSKTDTNLKRLRDLSF